MMHCFYHNKLIVIWCWDFNLSPAFYSTVNSVTYLCWPTPRMGQQLHLDAFFLSCYNPSQKNVGCWSDGLASSYHALCCWSTVLKRENICVSDVTSLISNSTKQVHSMPHYIDMQPSFVLYSMHYSFYTLILKKKVPYIPFYTYS